jgi:hypothetical protein
MQANPHTPRSSSQPVKIFSAQRVLEKYTVIPYRQ